jgi:hypothetical protein
MDAANGARFSVHYHLRRSFSTYQVNAETGHSARRSTETDGVWKRLFLRRMHGDAHAACLGRRQIFADIDEQLQT